MESTGTQEGTSTSNQLPAHAVQDLTSAFYVHPPESAGSTVVPVLFDGSGYRSWRRAVLRGLSPMSKLSPRAPEFVPTSKANPSMTMTVDSFKRNLAMNTKDIGVLAKSHDPEVIVSGISPTAAYDTDLGTDMFDGDDEEEMLDLCFDKVAKEGDLSPREQRSGSNKIKKKAHGRQHSRVVR